MSLYLASRRVLPLLLTALAISVLPSLASITAAFPSVIGGGSGSVVRISALAPAALAMVLAYSLNGRHTHLSATAVRSTAWMDATLLLGADAVVVAVTALLPGGDWAAARNTLILAAVTATAVAVSSPSVAGATLGLAILFILTYGTAAPGARFIRVLQAPAPDLWAVIVALVATLTAVLALAAVRIR